MARVALALLGGEPPRDLDLVAAVLPQRDAAGHRLDARVAELVAQRLGGERAAVARGAVQDDPRVAIGDRALDPRLEVATRDVLGARDVTLVPLLGLPDVDDRDGVAEQPVDLGGVDLVDLLLDLPDVVGAGGGHDADSP